MTEFSQNSQISRIASCGNDSTHRSLSSSTQCIIDSLPDSIDEPAAQISFLPRRKHGRNSNFRETRFDDKYSHDDLRHTITRPVMSYTEKLLQERVDTLELETKRLRHDLEKRETIEAQLRKDNVCLIRAKQERELASNDYLEHELLSRDKRNLELWEQVLAMRRVATFTAQDPNVPIHLPEEKINSTIDNLGLTLASIIHGHDPNIPLLTPNVRRECDLGSLMQDGLNQYFGWGTDEQEVLVTRYFSKTNPLLVVQSLVLTAIKRWVLESDFPNFADRICPLRSISRNTSKLWLVTLGILDTPYFC